jgi:hypothetical protein
MVGISLSPCTGLRRLTLGLGLSTAGGVEDLHSILVSLLQDESAPALATLTLRVSLGMQLLDLPWGQLDAVLAKHRFPSLDPVVFDVLHRDRPQRCFNFEEFEDRVGGVMVGLRQRGLLQFRRFAF